MARNLPIDLLGSLFGRPGSALFNGGLDKSVPRLLGAVELGENGCLLYSKLAGISSKNKTRGNRPTDLLNSLFKRPESVLFNGDLDKSIDRFFRDIQVGDLFLIKNHYFSSS